MSTESDNTVFISYRRSVSAFVARAVFMDLRAHGYDVFMDVQSIDSGAFDRIILNQIAARSHFVLILTPGSVEGCAKAGDWLRREVERAIDLRRNIVPVLAHGFKMEDYQELLTGKLSEVLRFSALNVPHDYFEEAMDRLRTRFLKQPVPGAIQPAPHDEQSVVEQKIAQAATLPAPSRHELTANEQFELGKVAYFLSSYDWAVDHYSEAIKLDPRRAEFYSNRGRAYILQGDLTRALIDCDAAINLNPELAEAHGNRGITHFLMREYQVALADFEEAVRLRSWQHWPVVGVALCQHALGSMAEARRHWQTLIDAEPAFGDPEWVRGGLGWPREMVDEASRLVGSLPA
jgi:tetratricopeptide (TPR) repeat protein